MKLSNLFKKGTKSTTNSVNVEKLEKNQLEKVIGGIDTIAVAPTVIDCQQVNKAKSNVKDN